MSTLYMISANTNLPPQIQIKYYNRKQRHQVSSTTSSTLYDISANLSPNITFFKNRKSQSSFFDFVCGTLKKPMSFLANDLSSL